MTITTKTGLWQLAATLMGIDVVNNVIDATAPTTALERTFTHLYDQIRIAQIKSGKFDFARRTSLLYEAPTVDAFGVSHVWTERWSHVYGLPSNALMFLRWRDQLPEAGETVDYQEIQLPISYSIVQATGVVGFVTSSVGVANNLPAYPFRNGMRALFVDEGVTLQYLVDEVNETTSPPSIGFKHVGSDVILPTSGVTYIGGTAWDIDFEPGALAGAYTLTSGAQQVVLTVAYGLPQDWTGLVKLTNHIATDWPPAEAYGVFLMDESDEADWPVEFQNSVAAELAYRAANGHAKSPRLLKELKEEKFVAWSTAISTLSSDDGYVEGGGPSRATLARR